MIALKSNNSEFIKYLTLIMSQLGLKQYKTDELNQPFLIELDYKEHLIKINPLGLEKKKIQLPCRITKIIQEIEMISKEFYFKIEDLFFFPISQELTMLNKDISVKLNYIHNTILAEMVLNQTGISKTDLYKMVWPNDKEIQINKLDTHITNLKTIINNKFNKKIIFESQHSIIKIK